MRKQVIIIISLIAAFVSAKAQSPITISPYGIVAGTGEEVTSAVTGDAPFTVTFYPGESNTGSCNEFYEWRFYKDKDGGSAENPYLIRHEKETTVTFTEAGNHKVVVYAYFTQGTDTIEHFVWDNYWCDQDPISIEISESKLEMPNAFSPNGDGANDIYKAKEGFRSIISFHAVIYSRWGQKLYEWNDVNGGWDGRFHGTYVKDGVYFCHVQAQGADGRVYDIKRDVNVLKGLNKPEN